MSDSRTGKRFPLNLPITLRQGKSSKGERTTTSDVSAAGIYIHADSKLKIGSKIDFDIVLPAKIVGAEHDIQVLCKGRVVRAEAGKAKTKADAKGGVGCVIDSYKFVRKK